MAEPDTPILTILEQQWVLRDISKEELKQVCEQLRECARKACHGNSDTCDRIEWYAAKIIEGFIKWRSQEMKSHG